MILRRLFVAALALLGFCPAGHAAPQAMVAAAHPLAVEAGLDVLRRGGSALDLQREAVRLGMKTLRQSGLTKLEEGVTTLEEVLRVTAPD